MTGSNTDRVSFPACHRAAALLLQLASPVFKASMRGKDEPSPNDELFETWWTLRSFAQAISDRGSVRITGPDYMRLQGALKIAHDVAHDFPRFAPPADGCGCEESSSIRHLLALLVSVHAPEAALL